MKKESLDDELKGLSPLLREVRGQDDSFRVPEGYFGALEDSVLGRVDASAMRRKQVMGARRGGLFARFSRSQVAWAVAAALTLVLAATWLFRTPPQTDALQAATAQELTEEEIEAYVLENIRDFDAELLADVPVNSRALPETKPASPAETKTKTSDPLDDLSDEELELLLKEMSDEELENLLKT